MTLLEEYLGARHDEGVARLRRIFALRAMRAGGMSQRRIADALGISQPAVSQQLKGAAGADAMHPELVLEAAASILKALAAEHGFTRLAVFGSLARRDARPDSDIDLIVEARPDASTFDLIRFKLLVEQVLGREIDLIEYGGLTPGLDDDIRREAMLL